MDKQTQWWIAAGVTGVLALVTAIGSTADLEAQAKAAAPRAKAAAPATGATQAAASQSGGGSAASANLAARGKYLVTTGACEDCHSPWMKPPNGPPMPDPARELSGHPASIKLTPPPRLTAGWGMISSETHTAFSGPWGISFAANLTPDKETGLGNWTEEMFVSALRKGRHAGVERQILPPMPWLSYAQFTDQDLKAIFAYLRTLKPVKNAVPSPAPPMPVS